MSLETLVIFLQLLLVFFLIGRNEFFVLVQRVFAPKTHLIKKNPKKIKLMSYVLVAKIFEAETKLGLVFGGRLFAVKEVLEEDISHLHGTLVDRGGYTPLESQSQQPRIGWHLIHVKIHLGDFLLNVLYGNLDGRQLALKKGWPF